MSPAATSTYPPKLGKNTLWENVTSAYKNADWRYPDEHPPTPAVHPETSISSRLANIQIQISATRSDIQDLTMELGERMKVDEIEKGALKQGTINEAILVVDDTGETLVRWYHEVEVARHELIATAVRYGNYSDLHSIFWSPKTAWKAIEKCEEEMVQLQDAGEKLSQIIQEWLVRPKSDEEKSDEEKSDEEKSDEEKSDEEKSDEEKSDEEGPRHSETGDDDEEVEENVV